MKTCLLIGAIGLIIHTSGMAQAPNVIRVKGGVGGEKAVPFAARYRYGQFRAGEVSFLNGNSVAARFNYNVLLGEMHFITARGDTMALAEEPIVRRVAIDRLTIGDQSLQETLFLYDRSQGYIEIIADYAVVKLGVKEGLKTMKREKMGGYGQSTGASAITTYQFYSGGNTSVSKLDAGGDLLFMKEKAYYFVDQNSRYYPATKASLSKMFKSQRQQITAYLASDPVDFNQEDQLKRVLAYCSKLM